MNLANKITLFRLCLIPVFPLVFFSSLENRLTLALIVFLIAGISDVLDGYIARNYNMITPLGTVLDPLADKLMVLTVVSCFVYTDLLPLWLLLLYLVKEGIQIIIGTFFYFNKYKIQIPSNKFGKFGTAFLYALIIGVGLDIPNPIQKILLFISLMLALLAFVSYGKALIFEVKEER
ncbi:MAG: CDP-alcohol phosphatidyltransferase family protein [Tissierellia bacterium]|nr:CDP-alcohol phosphatidyltransferase family protein [Tissierellia bacterium]